MHEGQSDAEEGVSVAQGSPHIASSWAPQPKCSFPQFWGGPREQGGSPAGVGRALVQVALQKWPCWLLLTYHPAPRKMVGRSPHTQRESRRQAG